MHSFDRQTVNIPVVWISICVWGGWRSAIGVETDSSQRYRVKNEPLTFWWSCQSTKINFLLLLTISLTHLYVGEDIRRALSKISILDVIEDTYLQNKKVTKLYTNGVYSFSLPFDYFLVASWKYAIAFLWSIFEPGCRVMVYNVGDCWVLISFTEQCYKLTKSWFLYSKLPLDIEPKSLSVKVPQPVVLWFLWGKDLQATESWFHWREAFFLWNYAGC